MTLITTLISTFMRENANYIQMVPLETLKMLNMQKCVQKEGQLKKKIFASSHQRNQLACVTASN